MSAQSTPSRAGLLGMFAVLGSALVGFNSMVTSCSSDKAAKEAAQLHRIEQRERFWTDAIKDFDGVVSTASAAPAAKQDRVVRCMLLALRTAPFVEVPRVSRISEDGTEDLSADLFAYSSKVDKLQQAFIDQIGNEKIVDAECGAAFERARITEERRKDLTEREAIGAAVKVEPATVKGYDPSPPVAEAIAVRQDQISLTPISGKGWDIDVFWCERELEADSQANFTEALTLAQKLAAEEQNGNTLKGNLLGKIRVRKLPSNLLVTPEYRYYAGRRKVVSDDSNEHSLIEGMIGLDPNLSRLDRGPQNTAPRTQWYVSAFLCKAGGLAAAETVAPVPSAPMPTGRLPNQNP